MKRNLFYFSLGLILGIASLSNIVAQRAARSRVDVGSMLPNATLYDADGEKFELGSLRGHYAVIVFGCLT